MRGARGRAALVVAAAIVFVAAGMWLTRDRISFETARPKGVEGRVAQTVPRRPAESRREEVLGALRSGQDSAGLPASLRGTEIDGALHVGEDGVLILGPDVRRFFDYFLSATGEEAPEALAQRIREEIDERLPVAAAARGRDLLERYLTYRERARRLAGSDGRLASSSDRWDAIRELRHEVFGEEDAAALFGDEEAEVFVALAAEAVGRDPALSATEREQRRAALAAQLPAEARKAREEATAVLRLRREEAELRAAGADAAQVRALREEQFGSDAADRLDDLDRRRADWQRRIDDYRRARATIEADLTLSPAERSRALDALLSGSFSAPERLRVEALDRIATRPEEPGS